MPTPRKVPANPHRRGTMPEDALAPGRYAPRSDRSSRRLNAIAANKREETQDWRAGCPVWTSKARASAARSGRSFSGAIAEPEDQRQAGGEVVKLAAPELPRAYASHLTSRHQRHHFGDLDEFTTGRQRAQASRSSASKASGAVAQLFRRGGGLRKGAAHDFVLADGLADGDAEAVQLGEGGLKRNGS